MKLFAIIMSISKTYIILEYHKKHLRINTVANIYLLNMSPHQRNEGDVSNQLRKYKIR